MCHILAMYMDVVMEGEERSRLSVVQMDNLRVLFGIKGIYRMPNARVRELCSEN